MAIKTTLKAIKEATFTMGMNDLTDAFLVDKDVLWLEHFVQTLVAIAYSMDTYGNTSGAIYYSQYTHTFFRMARGHIDALVASELRKSGLWY